MNRFFCDCKWNLIFQLSTQVFPVQPRDMRNRDGFRTFCFAGSRVGAISKSEFIHFRNHGFSTFCPFNFTLRKQRELTNLSRYK